MFLAVWCVGTGHAGERHLLTALGVTDVPAVTALQTRLGKLDEIPLLILNSNPLSLFQVQEMACILQFSLQVLGSLWFILS